VDTTFVQFYPEILPTAIAHATLSKGLSGGWGWGKEGV